MPMIEWWVNIEEPDLLRVEYIDNQCRRFTSLHREDIDRAVCLLERWGWERTHNNTLANGRDLDRFYSVFGDPE